MTSNEKKKYLDQPLFCTLYSKIYDVIDKCTNLKKIT